MNDSVESTQLRVTVEMGDDYEPSERVTAALSELVDALGESDDEVSGFEHGALRSFMFDSNAFEPTRGDGSWKAEIKGYKSFDGKIGRVFKF